VGGREEQAPARREGRAGVALLPTPLDDRGLDVEPLLTEPRVVALAAADPLAARSCLHLADLAGRVLPDGTPADREGLPPTSVAEPRGDGRRPQTTAHPLVAVAHSRHLDLAQIFNMVELGSIVWFSPASLARRHSRPGIAYRTVSDLSPLTLALAWPQDSRSPAVAAFVHTATAVAATAYPADQKVGATL
jgi:DNA-binding transcriptional LysR family regulator